MCLPHVACGVDSLNIGLSSALRLRDDGFHCFDLCAQLSELRVLGS